ncbi:Cyclic di-GMP phosphodiesterase response regulator RpfG [Maioricimonas rarisocia]|uniref:Cyclic di-GMP phosphodiesterase response regulator RpfG n=1 Tax=Maioricimonas rarisocia TaxID=2528026 RepID=A0A517ZAC1_9PLAN|nr:HD-GYP domain-containing protein [Maioricimonas rarisocia]QDU39433.1 Cyclic di-GMP phosphodiesterase response regulator RpfG [Maioricimonas rarisocia]
MTLLSTPAIRDLERFLSIPAPAPVTSGPLEPEKIARQLTELTGLPFCEANLWTGELSSGPQADLFPKLPENVRSELQAAGKPSIVEADNGLIFYGVPLYDLRDPNHWSVGFVPRESASLPPELVVEATRQNWSTAEWDEWRTALPDRSSPKLIHRLILLAAGSLQEEISHHRREQEADDLARELDSVYEEISLLHMLAGNLSVSLESNELGRLCLSRIRDCVAASGCAVLLAGETEKRDWSQSGNLPFGAGDWGVLETHFEDHDWSTPFVKNQLESTTLGADFPGLRSLVVAAVRANGRRIGFVIACNARSGEFGSIEASLLNSVAMIISTHSCNLALFREQDEMLLSFVKSLVTTLDAKDSYTRGHSQRVALIAHRIARQLRLTEQETDAIYLSGLLHDIGKVGINDSILKKPGRLTDEEFALIQRHPVIGYDILSGLKKLQHILPGVRHHHESFNGTGYPDRLAGHEIPLMARVLAVADAFDAMGSNRSYRQGMPIERIETILHEGAGTQWDPVVVRAYFESRSDIHRIANEELTIDRLTDLAPRV